METKYYPPLKNREMESRFGVFIKYPDGHVQELSMTEESDLKKFTSTLLPLFQTKYRFSIDVYDAEDIEISMESKTGMSVIFHTTCGALFTAFADDIYNQFSSKEE